MCLYETTVFIFTLLLQYPDLKKAIDIEAHKNEIDDFDISPDGSKVKCILFFYPFYLIMDLQLIYIIVISYLL